jgi:hypothetical protein
LLTGEGAAAFGIRNWKLDESTVPDAVRESGLHGRLVLTAINEYHREYAWR